MRTRNFADVLVETQLLSGDDLRWVAAGESFDSDRWSMRVTFTERSQPFEYEIREKVRNKYTSDVGSIVAISEPDAMGSRYYWICLPGGYHVTARAEDLELFLDE